jgi:murein DD-endopeptidase MepM/ murein hydrolase activator NlpD
VAGVTVGVESLHRALAGIVDVTQQATQAQFALRAVYGQSAASFTKFAQEQSAALKISATGLTQGAVAAGTLSKNYAFTSEQIKTLITRSADLAAVSGRDVLDTTQRVIAAMRGEAEAAEILGLTLNSDAVKGMAAMTDAQRKNFESLGQVTKGQILFNELLRQSEFAQGAAAKRANESAGAFDRLKVSQENLGKALGSQLNPQLEAGASNLAFIIDLAGKAAGALGELQKVAQGGLLGVAARIAGQGDAFDRAISGASRPPGGFDPQDAATRRAPGQAESRAEAAQRARIALDDARLEGDTRIAIAKKVAAAALEAQQDIRESAEKSRREQLDAANDAEKAELRAIDETHRARIAANKADIDGAERAKDAAIDAAQERHDAAVDLIEDESKALARARELEDRDRSRIREQEDRDRAATRSFVDTTLDDRRGVEDRQLDDRRLAEDRALTDRRQAQDQAFDDERDAALKSLKDQEEARSRSVDAEIRSIERRKDRALRSLDQEADKARANAEKRIRSIEDRSDAELRALDEESDAARDLAEQQLRALEEEQDAARDNADQRIRAIEDQQRAEDTRHREAMDNLAAEEAAQLGAIDERLEALDTAQRKADEAERDAELSEARSRAGRGLDAAIRVGNPAAIAAARRAVADADAAITKERARRRQDATRRDLQDQADAIRKEFDAKKDALDAESDARKDAADAQQREIRDVLDAQLDALGKQQQAIRDVLDSTLDALEQRKRAVQDEADEDQRRIQDNLARTLSAIDKRKQAVQDSTASEIASIRERDQKASDSYADEVERVTAEFELRQQTRDKERLAEDRALADGRKAEDLDIELSRKAQDEAIAASRLAEDQARADNRLAEDNERTDGRAAQDEDLRLRREASDDALKAERDAIDVAYNGPEGILTLLRKATDDINEEHRLQRQSVDDKYNGEGGIKDIINATWDAVVERSEDVTKDIKKQLDQQVSDWDTWKNGTLPKIQEVIDKVNELIDRIKAIPGRVGTGPTVEVDGGGMALPPGSGGGLAYGPVVKNASDNSYWTSAGTHGGHPAADIFAPAGSPIYSPVDGTIDSYSVSKGGNAATLIGADGRAYYFAHAQSQMSSGSVSRGQQIGRVGNTGNAANTASHLHFAISESGAGTFARFNGSGDVMGDASYWGDGGVGVGTGQGEWVEVELFGRTYRIFTNGEGGVLGDVGALAGSGPTGMSLIKAIEQLGTGIRNQDFGYAGAAIAHSEGAAGDLTRVGDGGSWGPFQFHPGGELQSYAKYLGFPVEQAGPYAGQNPLNAADWALRGYLGSALNKGIDQGIRGAPLAEYGSEHGQRPADELWRKAGDSFRQLYGYANGGPIPEPTLLYGLNSQRVYAMAGESGPEDVVPRRGGGSGVTVNINAPIFGVDHLHAEMDRAYDRNDRRKRHERTVRTR